MSYGMPANTYGIAAALPVSEGVYRRHPAPPAPPLSLDPFDIAFVPPMPTALQTVGPLETAFAARQWRPPWLQPKPWLSLDPFDIAVVPPMPTALQTVGPLVSPPSAYVRPPWFQPKPKLDVALSQISAGGAWVRDIGETTINDGTAVGSFSVTTTHAVSPGDTAVMGVFASLSGSQLIASISDGTNTWNIDAWEIDFGVASCYYPDGLATGSTITITFSGGDVAQYYGATISEFLGRLASDVYEFGVPVSSSDAPTATSGILATADGVMYGAVYYDAYPPAINVLDATGGSFDALTAANPANDDAPTTAGLLPAWEPVTSSAPVAFAPTVSTAVYYAQAVLVHFHKVNQWVRDIGETTINDGTAAGSFSVTTTGAIAPGDTAIAGFFATTSQIASISDGTNAWTVDAFVNNEYLIFGFASCYYPDGLAAGSTITFNISPNSGFYGASISEFVGQLVADVTLFGAYELPPNLAVGPTDALGSSSGIIYAAAWYEDNNATISIISNGGGFNPLTPANSTAAIPITGLLPAWQPVSSSLGVTFAPALTNTAGMQDARAGLVHYASPIPPPPPSAVGPDSGPLISPRSVYWRPPWFQPKPKLDLNYEMLPPPLPDPSLQKVLTVEQAAIRWRPPWFHPKPWLALDPYDITFIPPAPPAIQSMGALETAITARMWRPPWFQPKPLLVPDEGDIGPAPPLDPAIISAGVVETAFAARTWRAPFLLPKPWLDLDIADITFVPPLDPSLMFIVVSPESVIMWRPPWFQPKPWLALDPYDITFIPPMPDELISVGALQSEFAARTWRPPWFQPKPWLDPNPGDIGPAPPLGPALQADGPVETALAARMWRPPFLLPKPLIMPDEGDIGPAPPLDPSLMRAIETSLAARWWRPPFLLPKPWLSPGPWGEPAPPNVLSYLFIIPS